MAEDIQAVIWDFGGVLTSSPFEAFNRYEADNGLPKDFIRGVNARNGETNAWAKLEQSKVTAEEFINKYNVSVNQVERLEKSKWFLDKHATRLSRDFMELEEQQLF